MTIPRFGGVLLLDSVFDGAVAAQQGEWAKRVVLSGRNSVAGSLTSWVGVAMRDIEQGRIGRVCTGGVCHALVNLTNAAHRYATIAASGTALASAARGPIRILAITPGAPETGEKYCIVWVGPPLSEPTEIYARITAATAIDGAANRWWYSWEEVEWSTTANVWEPRAGGLSGGPDSGLGPAVNSVENDNDGEHRESAGVDLDSGDATVTLLPIGANELMPVYLLRRVIEGDEPEAGVWEFRAENDVDVECAEPIDDAAPILYSAFGALGGLLTGLGAGDAGELLPGADHTVIVAASTADEGLAYDYRHRLIAAPMTADGSPVANTTTETAIATVAVGALMDAVGACLRVTFAGDIQSTGSSVSCTLRLKLGGVTIRTWVFTFASTTGGAAGWTAGAVITTRTAGATGNVHVADLGGGVLRTMLQLAAGETSGAIDLTDAGNDLELTAQWSAASTNHSVQVEQVLTEGLTL
ncbi:MAG TPA: hypothetical protein PKC43_06245 [Phycisphaerales bacterium]|nr:hypothetical protein [Phycisphaerales bacterium]HMP37032.1 hypothetical protein [Phycisphaerales bacterium]